MKKYLLTLAALVCTLFATAQAPAFPGAEGHGRYVTGGRGGTVIHVTNLNDKGAGSFRNAVSGNSKKIVVFDVGGVIPLASDITIGENTTILGQTAPAPGITLRYYTVKPNNNVIMRFIRVRRGQEKDVNDGADAITTWNKTGMIFDHCSFSWSIDEVASFYDNNNFTMQWCTLGESLNDAGHGKGAHGYGGIWGGKLASFHHNLILHVNNRSPRFNGARYEWNGYTNNKLYSEYKWENYVQAENVDFRNCVTYNTNGCYGGPGGGQINMVNNYMKSGPAAKVSKLTQVTVGASGNSSGHPNAYGMTSRYYVSGNLIDGNDAGWNKFTYDDGTITQNGKRYSKDPKHLHGANAEYITYDGTEYVCMQLDAPAPVGEVTTHSALKAFDKVLTYSGASLHMDNVDERYFDEARNGTAKFKNGRIDLVADCNGYTEEDFGTGSRAADFDTDKDGIPDAWETANGLNPNNATDAVTYTLDPAKYYNNLEVYANSLVQDIMVNGNKDAEDAAKEYYPAYKKEDGTAVEAINTLGLDISGGTSGDTGETKIYSVMFNGSNTENPTGFFTFNPDKHNFNPKFTGTYNGTNYTQGLKMEGQTLVQFTTTGISTVIIVQSDWESAEKPHGTPKSIKFDGTEQDFSTASIPAGSTGVCVYTIAGVGAGTHKITRGSGESGIFYVEIQETIPTGISTTTAKTINNDGNIYNLAGQRVDESYKGLIIKDGKKYYQK